MRDPKPGEEINGTIGQKEFGVYSWIEQWSWFPGFLIVKKFSVQAGILGPSLPAREHRLPVYPH